MGKALTTVERALASKDETIALRHELPFDSVKRTTADQPFEDVASYGNGATYIGSAGRAGVAGASSAC